MEVESKKADLVRRMTEANERRLAHIELLLQQARIASERQAAVQQAREARRMTWVDEVERSESAETESGGGDIEPGRVGGGGHPTRRKHGRGAAGRRKHGGARGGARGGDGAASGDESRSESARSERSLSGTVQTSEMEAGEPLTEHEEEGNGIVTVS